MPTRILREGILTSERVNALSERAELFYRRLYSAADDYGRYFAHPALLRAACYPLRVDQVKESEIAKYLVECAQAVDNRESLITIYAVKGTNYIQINDFRQQRRANSKFPEPLLNECKSNDKQMCADLTSDPTTPSTTTVVKGGVGGEGFETFWEAYPRKVGKGKARALWDKLRPSADLLAQMVSALADAKTSPQWSKDHGQFIPHPSTWLSESRWDDDLSDGQSKAVRDLTARIMGRG